jgi:hypothetical protein
VEPSLLLLTPLSGILYWPRKIMDDDECGAVGGMLGRGSRCTCREPAPVPLWPPQIPLFDPGWNPGPETNRRNYSIALDAGLCLCVCRLFSLGWKMGLNGEEFGSRQL